jgi:hypothetical protein
MGDFIRGLSNETFKTNFTMDILMDILKRERHPEMNSTFILSSTLNVGEMLSIFVRNSKEKYSVDYHAVLDIN